MKKNHWLCKDCGQEHHILESNCSKEKDANWDLMIKEGIESGLISPEQVLKWQKEDERNKEIHRRLALHMEGN